MQDQQPRRQIPLGVLAGLSVLMLTTGSAVAWWTWNTQSRNPIEPKNLQQPEHAQPKDEAQSAIPKVARPVEPSKTQPSPAPATVDKTLEVYWLKTSGNAIQLAPSPVKLASSSDSQLLLEKAVKKLLAGPMDSSSVTSIPKGTQLHTIQVKDDGVHVDLSAEFTSGGGSTSMTGRLGQIIYTATSLNPEAPIWITVDGKQLQTLGGEGLVLDQPLTRDRFQKDFPL